MTIRFWAVAALLFISSITTSQAEVCLNASTWNKVLAGEIKIDFRDLSNECFSMDGFDALLEGYDYPTDYMLVGELSCSDGSAFKQFVARHSEYGIDSKVFIYYQDSKLIASYVIPVPVVVWRFLRSKDTMRFVSSSEMDSALLENGTMMAEALKNNRMHPSCTSAQYEWPE